MYTILLAYVRIPSVQNEMGDFMRDAKPLPIRMVILIDTNHSPVPTTDEYPRAIFPEIDILDLYAQVSGDPIQVNRCGIHACICE